MNIRVTLRSILLSFQVDCVMQVVAQVVATKNKRTAAVILDLSAGALEQDGSADSACVAKFKAPQVKNLCSIVYQCVLVYLHGTEEKQRLSDADEDRD